MVKLDIQVIHKITTRWCDVILASVEKRNQLEKLAKVYESQSGRYIRPICLIQVERTGSNQIGSGYIHAEDVKSFLINECNINPDEVAIKSSEKDDIEGIDLLSRDCSIRYIITKQALQEGWDCSFAYILTVLADSRSKTNITQLVGRILRQPYAQKTTIKELDQSYVFCYTPNAKAILDNIKRGLENEGLGDVADRVDTWEAHFNDVAKGKEPSSLKKNIYRPGQGKKESDNCVRIDWTRISLDSMENLTLPELETTEHELLRQMTIGSAIDLVFLTRNIMQVVPNPWIAYQISEKAISILKRKYSEEDIAANLVFILNELVKLLEEQRNTQI